MASLDEHRMYRDRALNHLRWNWGEAYDIGEGLGAWRAVRRDNGVTLVAADPAELKSLIVADYARQPVPRDV